MVQKLCSPDTYALHKRKGEFIMLFAFALLTIQKMRERKDERENNTKASTSPMYNKFDFHLYLYRRNGCVCLLVIDRERKRVEQLGHRETQACISHFDVSVFFFLLLLCVAGVLVFGFIYQNESVCEENWIASRFDLLLMFRFPFHFIPYKFSIETYK